MPTDLSSFQKDLISPEAGKDSELYRAIGPLLDLNNLPEGKTKFDQERIEKLKNDLRQGTLGLEYLTGLKNNKVETFFDSHPIQATTSNILGNAGKLGLGVAGGGTLINALRHWKNFNKTENANDARSNDPKQQMGSKLNSSKLNPINNDGAAMPVDEDLLRIFGSANTPAPSVGQLNFTDLEKRVRALDQVAGSQARPAGQNFTDRLQPLKKEYSAALARGAAGVDDLKVIHEKIRSLMQETRGSKELGALKGYAGIATDLQRLKDKGQTLKGGVGSSIGDKLLANDKVDSFLSRLPAGLQSAIKSAIPSSAQPVEELTRRRILKQQPNNYSEETLKDILSDTHNLDFSGPSPSDKTKVFERGAFGATGALKNQSRLNRVLRFAGAPVAVGAGIAGAGMGMNALLKLIQSKVYGKDQISEWKRNALKAKGEFEEANRIK
jgi:hypothetical protein